MSYIKDKWNGDIMLLNDRTLYDRLQSARLEILFRNFIGRAKIKGYWWVHRFVQRQYYRCDKCRYGSFDIKQLEYHKCVATPA